MNTLCNCILTGSHKVFVSNVLFGKHDEKDTLLDTLAGAFNGGIGKNKQPRSSFLCSGRNKLQ